MTALTSAHNDMVVVPIRGGLGLWLGYNVGYLKFAAAPTWNPFLSGTFNSLKWNDFRKAQCGAEASVTAQSERRKFIPHSAAVADPPRRRTISLQGRRSFVRPVRTDWSDGGNVDPDRGSKSRVMTEPVVYFGIGFFVAALLGLLIVLHAHNRAARPGSVDQFHADVRQLEEQLAVALGERSTLQREIAAIKRDAEMTWAAERVENALFRERINDVAGEVVRITQALESLGSPIEPMSAFAILEIGQGGRTRTLGINATSGETGTQTIDTARNNNGALADRIRALRTTASRAAAN